MYEVVDKTDAEMINTTPGFDPSVCFKLGLVVSTDCIFLPGFN